MATIANMMALFPISCGHLADFFLQVNYCKMNSETSLELYE